MYLDLADLKRATKADETDSFEFLVINHENAESLASMNQTYSRRLKGTHNAGSGYYSYAVALDGKIIGDIWCATHMNVKRDPIHPDLDMLGITCGDNEAYMFDMHVAPDSRGKVVTGYLLRSALHHLKESGFDRAYGFYEKNNLPALWTHRLFGYKELANRKVTQVLLYKKTEVLASRS